jgi:hypothetical protein
VAPTADRTGWSFAQVLDRHLTTGTRPESSPDAGKQWTNATFAHAVNSDERTVRNWRRARNVPVDIRPIERALFGENPVACRERRIELRKAHQADRTSPKDGEPRIPAAAIDKPIPASNIPIRVPTHFMGRDDALEAIDTALKRYEGRVAITALHGLRGIGKTTLAAAYAERHRGDYRAMWWIRAQTESSMRADLVALGVRLGWAGAGTRRNLRFLP